MVRINVSGVGRAHNFGIRIAKAMGKQNDSQSGERRHILHQLLLDLNRQRTVTAILRKPFRFEGTLQTQPLTVEGGIKCTQTWKPWNG